MKKLLERPAKIGYGESSLSQGPLVSICVSRFPVHESYLLCLSDCSPRIVAQGPVKRKYDPSDTDIIIDLQNFDTQDYQAGPDPYLDFCNKYGIPTSQNDISIAEFRQLVNEYQDTYQLWGAICSNDEQVVLRLIKDFDSLGATVNNVKQQCAGIDPAAVEEVIKDFQRSTEFKAYTEVKHRDAITRGRQYLALQLNQNVHVDHSVQPCDGYIASALSFVSPLAYAWYELAQIVLAGVIPRKCPNCETYFVPTRDGQFFCPEAPTFRSNCENTYAKRVIRKKTAILEELAKGVSVIEIAGRYRFDVEYLQSRINIWLSKAEI